MHTLLGHLRQTVPILDEKNDVTPLTIVGSRGLLAGTLGIEPGRGLDLQISLSLDPEREDTLGCALALRAYRVDKSWRMSPHWGLNPGPSVYRTDALPLSYRGDKYRSVPHLPTLQL